MRCNYTAIRGTNHKRKQVANWISSKFKTCALQNDNAKKMKRLGETERKYNYKTY